MDPPPDYTHTLKRLAEWILKHPENKIVPHGPATLESSQIKMLQLLQAARSVGYHTVDASHKDARGLVEAVCEPDNPTLVIRTPRADMPPQALSSLWCRYIMEKARAEDEIDPWEFVLSQFVINTRTSTESVFTPLLTTPQQFIATICEDSRCVK